MRERERLPDRRQICKGVNKIRQRARGTERPNGVTKSCRLLQQQTHTHTHTLKRHCDTDTSSNVLKKQKAASSLYAISAV